MKVAVISFTENMEGHIEYCARVSHNSVKEVGNNNLLRMLLTKGHLSVFEHAYVSFYVEGISRSTSHQLVRHRIASYTQRSQRYVFEKDFKYITPNSILNNQEALNIYNGIMRRIYDAYIQLLGLGISKEDARFLLSNATSTSLVMTANLREWLHIIDVRVSEETQWEIRELVILIWRELYHLSPNIFGFTYFDSWSKDVGYKHKVFYERITKWD